MIEGIISWAIALFPRQKSRAFISLPILVILFCLASPEWITAQGPPENRAGLVIQFAKGDALTRCVALGEGTLSGEKLLEKSGLKVLIDYSSVVGQATCKIEGTGCNFPAEDCFCQCQGAKCAYWNYYHMDAAKQAEGWQYSQLGAGMTTVRPGDLEGWAWGDTGITLPPFRFDKICPPAQEATPTSTAPPSATRETSATAPPSTATPSRAPTATPLASASPGTGGNYELFIGAILLVAIIAFISRRRRRE